MHIAEERLHLRKKRIERHGRQLTVMVTLCAFIVVVSTLEVLMLANAEGFRIWKMLNPEGTAAEYSAMLLVSYLVDILIPAGIAIYTYFSIARLGTPRTYRLVWGAIVFLATARKVLTMRTQSVFWYVSLLFWGILFLVVINIHRLEKNSSTERM
ncbi:MAG: hypothetical protein GX910_05960 [Clostridiaceae bacterium]|nr:hypothetical protein [Clostridiaceae bacterium]